MEILTACTLNGWCTAQRAILHRPDGKVVAIPEGVMSRDAMRRNGHALKWIGRRIAHNVFTEPREFVKVGEVKLSLSKPRRHTRGLEVWNHSFLTSEWKWVISLSPRPLYFRYPSHRRLGGPQSRSGLLGKRGKPLILAQRFYCSKIVKGEEYVGEFSRDERLR